MSEIDKEQLVNDMAQAVFEAWPSLDPREVSRILTVAAYDYSVAKAERALAMPNADLNKELVQRFLVAKKVAGRSMQTCRYYKMVLEGFFAKVNKNAADVVAADITLYLARKEIDGKNSAVSRDNIRRVLGVFFAWLVDQEVIARNPCSKVQKVKVPKMQKKAFTDYEIEKIRFACGSDLERCLVELLLSTGCRIGEVELIKERDISGDEFTVHGKGCKDRTVYLNAKARHALDVYRGSEYFASRSGASDGGLFLCQRRKGCGKFLAIKKNGLERIIREIGKRAGVDDCHPHRFRRTCATKALKRGMPIEQVSMMLGHEDIDTTRIYLDLAEDDLRQSHRKYMD